MKIAIIGTNFVSDVFMFATKQFENLEVVTACSLTKEQAREFADRYKIPNSTDDYKEISGVDFVYVAVPNSVHAEIVKHFLTNNIAVICEKPFMINSKQTNEILELSRVNDTFIMENLIPPYSPAVAKARELLKEIGPIRSVMINQSQYSSRYDAYLAGKNPLTFNPDYANGAIIDLGIYAISWAKLLFGNPKSITSKSHFLESGADVNGTSIFEYDGFNAVIMYGKANSTMNWNEIAGEKGTIRFNSASAPTEIQYYAKDKTLIEEFSFNQNERMYFVIKAAIEAIQNGDIETPQYTHGDISELHKLLTEVRHQSGIKFKALGE